MTQRVVYKDENLDPIGEREVELTDFVIDDVLRSLDIPAEITLDSPLPHIEQIEIVNLLDKVADGKQVDSWHLSLSITVPEINIDKMWFHFNLFYEFIERNKKELASILGVELTEVEGFPDLPKGSGIFGWVNIYNPYFFTSKPLTDDFTYLDLITLCSNVEAWISSRVDDVMHLAKNVKSSPPPEYDDYRKSAFICHSSMDKRFAKKLAVALREKSVRVWLDEDEVLVGQDFVKQLAKGVMESDFVVVILTPNFVEQGPWAQEEFRMALSRQVSEQKIRILPVLKKDCTIPEMLRTKHYADFRKDFGAGLNKLLSSIRRLGR